jgi:hypothetical protein
MMNRRSVSGIVLVIFIALLAGCVAFPTLKPQEGVPAGQSITYSFWKGDIPNSCYSLNMDGERGIKITGKPFMILNYDPVSGVVKGCEFGLSEVTQEPLQTPSGDPAFPEPTLDATALDYSEKLNLKSPVVLLIGWEAPITTYEEFSSGLWQFSVKKSREEYRFNFNTGLMEGDVKNLDLNTYFGLESDSKAFKLIKV